MSSIESNLLPAERVLYRTRAHWVVFIPALVWSGIALYFFCRPSDSAYILLSYFFGMAALPVWLQAVVNFATAEFCLTDQRVLMKVGLIRRHSLETLLAKVEGIQVYQHLLGQLFNFGTITVCGVGGSRDVFKNIYDPWRFSRLVREKIAEHYKTKSSL